MRIARSQTRQALGDVGGWEGMCASECVCECVWVVGRVCVRVNVCVLVFKYV